MSWGTSCKERRLLRCRISPGVRPVHAEKRGGYRHDLDPRSSRPGRPEHRALFGTPDDREVLLREGAQGPVRPRVRRGDSTFPQDNAHASPELRNGAHVGLRAHRGTRDAARQPGWSLVRADRVWAARVLVLLDAPLYLRSPAPLRGLPGVGDRCAATRLERGAGPVLPTPPADRVLCPGLLPDVVPGPPRLGVAVVGVPGPLRAGVCGDHRGRGC